MLGTATPAALAAVEIESQSQRRAHDAEWRTASAWHEICVAIRPSYRLGGCYVYDRGSMRSLI